MTRRPALAWLAIVVPLWVTFALCCAWEPIVRDSWGHLHWHRQVDMSFDVVYEFAKGNYLHNNPRLGQVATFLMMTPGPWHWLITPLIELAMFYLATALVLARWPSVRRADDAYAFVVTTAVVAVCSPVIGQMLFYRPFTGNYLVGMVLDLAWLVPYRFAGEAGATRRPASIAIAAALGMFVLGFAGGECNEHVAPAIGLLAAAFAWPRRREPRPWMIAGALGLIAGWIALLVAPGQDIRYNALATETGTLGRIAERGVLDDLWLVVKPDLYLLAALPWLAIAAIGRVRGGAAPLSPPTRLALLALGAASVVIAVTLLGSPKQGERLYFAAVVLAAIAIAGWLVAVARTRGLRIAAVAVSALVLAVICERCLETYYVVGRESAARIELLDRAAPGSVVTVPRYTREHSRWFLGEDFDADDHRHLVAHDFGLADIQLAP
nr:DUF6056 family protein [Kofleriaceae bacterium]